MPVAASMLSRLDKLGTFASVLLFLALLVLPVLNFQPNRISSGEGRLLLEIFPPPQALAILLGFSLLAFVAMARLAASFRLGAAIVGLVALFWLAGSGGELIIPKGNPFARAAIGSGFWVACLALGLLLADALVALKATPVMRVVTLCGLSALLAALLKSGHWDGLSLLKEYKNQSAFWSQAGRHIMLSLGSLLPAILIGVPLGIRAHRSSVVRAISFPVLNILQTVPSLAMFGILMIPLGYIAANYPVLADMGIRGIGAAPAIVALFFYSLLPIVANTAVGFDKLEPSVLEAARGMGLSRRQRLFQVELPLAMPVMLTGIRIVLIQNIGIVAVAGLIGGGGFGTYIFKGLNQTATELVILGALPTLYLAFSAAVLMDSVIAHLNGRQQ
ncbi:MAG: ABC transporter permease [Cohaesibacter sp.]|jgi:osmoprotectant transport system permease protein|nr:ABC transporter permease [Cohaesibacter sp.]